MSESLDHAITRIWLTPVVREIANPIMLLLAAGAFIFFLWGVFKFIRDAADESARQEGRTTIAYSLVGLVLIFGVYGFLNTVLGIFNLGPVERVTAPVEFAAGNLNPSNSIAVASSSDSSNFTFTIHPSDVVPDEYLSLSKFSLAPQKFSPFLADAASGNTSAANNIFCSPPSPPFYSPTHYELTLPITEVLLLLRSVAERCPVEMLASYIEYGSRNFWDSELGGNTSVGVGLLLMRQDNFIHGQQVTHYYIGSDLAAPSLDTGIFNGIHTHPGINLPQTLSGVVLRNPPDLPDVTIGFFMTLAALSINPEFSGRLGFWVVSAEGIYKYDTTTLSQRYVDEFKKSTGLDKTLLGPLTPQKITDTLVAMKFVNTALSQRTDFPLNLSNANLDKFLKLQGVYLADQDTANKLLPNPHSQKEIDVAYEELISAYRDMGVVVTFTPWP